MMLFCFWAGVSFSAGTGRKPESSRGGGGGVENKDDFVGVELGLKCWGGTGELLAIVHTVIVSCAFIGLLAIWTYYVLWVAQVDINIVRNPNESRLHFILLVYSFTLGQTIHKQIFQICWVKLTLISFQCE